MNHKTTASQTKAAFAEYFRDCEFTDPDSPILTSTNCAVCPERSAPVTNKRPNRSPTSSCPSNAEQSVKQHSGNRRRSTNSSTGVLPHEVVQSGGLFALCSCS